MTSVRQARQLVLAGEQQAVFTYGALGPYLSAAPQVTLARQCQQAHRDSADAVSVRLALDGQFSHAALPDYQLSLGVADAVAAQRLAIRLEEQVASAWRYLLAIILGAAEEPGRAEDRAECGAGLSAAAVRAVRWRMELTPTAPSVAFPGI